MIRKAKVKKVCIALILILLLCISGCKSTFYLQNAKDADQQILEEIQSKKVVFIGENHSTVFPIFFMTQKMEDFYQAGVRYLFLEEEGDGFLPAGDYDDYKVIVTPPWCTFGWKYEYHLMELEIARINSLHPEDPIKVIFPEKGFVMPDDENDGTKVLNARDSQAQKTIIQTLDSSKPEEKAIIFYGDGHGSKIPLNYYNYEDLWYPTGYYLNQHYGDQYSSFRILYLRNDDYTRAYYGKDSNFKILSDNYLAEFFTPEELNNYDFISVTNQRIYGIIYPYIINDNNLTALYNSVADFDFQNIAMKSSYEVTNLVMGISYLKYTFRDYFPFSFEKNNMGEALAFLEEKVFQSGKAPSSFCGQFPSFTMEEWERYAEYLFSYKWLEDYIYDYLDEEYKKDAVSYVLYNMEHAIEMNPYDPWPKYWLAYFMTEKATSSGKERDYKEALSAWESFLSDDASPACPGLLIAYERIALCYSELEESDKALLYEEKAGELKKSFPWDSLEMYFFGG